MGIDLVYETIRPFLGPSALMSGPLEAAKLKADVDAPGREPEASLSTVPSPMRSLELGFKRLPLSAAVTTMGLPPHWVERLQSCHEGRSQVSFVEK